MSKKANVGVLISGRGSNLQALLDAARAPDYPARIALVICNVEEAQGLDRARAEQVPTAVIQQKDFADRESFDAAMDTALRAAEIDYVCLAGFMRILSGSFVDGWRDRLINIHPSLLPSFKGLNVHDRVVEAGVRITGCTVHFVRPEMDSGPIIAQAAAPVRHDDDAEALAARVLELEHRIYPLALGLLAAGRLRISGEKVLIEDPQDADGDLLQPPD